MKIVSTGLLLQHFIPCHRAFSPSEHGKAGVYFMVLHPTFPSYIVLIVYGTVFSMARHSIKNSYATVSLGIPWDIYLFVWYTHSSKGSFPSQAIKVILGIFHTCHSKALHNLCVACEVWNRDWSKHTVSESDDPPKEATPPECNVKKLWPLVLKSRK